MRAAIDLRALGERQLIVDCDVIEADGGTRTASIVGGFVALALALQKIKARDGIEGQMMTRVISAISVGQLDHVPLLDLCYIEDSKADVDMNVVMADASSYVEVQGTGEHSTYTRSEMNAMLDLAEKACRELQEMQMKIIGKLP